MSMQQAVSNARRLTQSEEFWARVGFANFLAALAFQTVRDVMASLA